MKQAYRNISIALCFSLISITAVANEQAGEEAHDGEQTHGKNVFAIFAGITREHDENHETFGFEYSRRINQSWSVGGVIERAERDKHSTLAIIFAHWWPYKGLFVGAGAGRKDPGEARENTIRTTIGYEFELGGGWVIAPEANLDIIERHESEAVYGIAFGKQF